MSDTSEEDVGEELIWNNLPEVLVIKIFSYLSLVDRVHASVLCHSWSKSFDSPVLWRNVMAEFVGDVCDQIEDDSDEEDASQLHFSNDRALTLAEKYGNYIKFLRITVNPVEKMKTSEIERKISEFLSKLKQKECSLLEFVVCDRHFYCTSVCSTQIAKNFVDSLVEFIACQGKLEKLKFSSWHFGEDVRILEALSGNCGASMKYINFLMFNYDDQRKSIQARYCNVLKRMPKLKKIGLSMLSMDSEVLTTLLENCRSLDTITISMFGTDYPPQFLLSSEWKRALEQLPLLKVNFKGFVDLNYSQVPKAMVPFMPLSSVELEFEANSIPHSKWNLHQVLDYLSGNFFKTLESVVITNESNSEVVDAAIMRMVVTCRKLKDLKIDMMLSLDTINQICKLQDQQKIDLQTFWVKAKGYSKDDLIQLKAALDSNRKTIGKRDWLFSD